jgi:uncharacterized repeat protein (TIGR01451 family)
MQELERPSRQDLVVPLRQSNLPLVLGAILCASTGFGLVWAFGIGRSPAGGESVASAQAAVSSTDVESDVAFATQEPLPAVGDAGVTTRQNGNATWEPRPLPEADNEANAPRAMHERDWRPPASPAAGTPVEERYPARPATLETPVDEQPLPPVSEGSTSRFTPPGRFPGTGAEPIRLASAESVASDTQASDTQLPAEPADAALPVDDGSELPPPAANEVADSAVAPPPPEAFTAAAPAPQPPLEQPPLPPSPAAAGDLLPPAPAPPPTIAPPVSPPAPARRFTSSDVAAPPASFRPAAIAPVPPATALSPVPAPSPVVGAAATTNPFASAPPMGPAPSLRTAPGAAGGGVPQPNAPETTGQGRPGAMQLEGLQTPQLAVEKRGPREIQVGKPVRYEILVRNVGTATAQDVTLRDAVPYGTTLITTTPPASPASAGPSAGLAAGQGGAAAAELVWPLGPLAPGGEARVSMEVMPQIEGEIGSVASVTFRTEASARSRATKPDLRLEASETKAVRIGGEVKLSLKVSNPGTGIATGVVLEGELPAGVAHSAGRELEFDVGQLRPGESRTIDLVMGSTGPGVHMARFAARADGQLEVEQPVRIEITAPTLELSTEMPSRRYLQRPATCVLTMVNAGTAPARSVELAAQLPPGMKFVRANHAGWYEERSHRVLWNLEELPPGEVGAVEMVLMPVDLGPQKIVAAARSSDGPSDQTSHTVEVEGLAALFFEVTDSEDPIEVGGMTEFIVRIGNQGTKAASGVRLTATLLGDLEPVDAKGPAAHRVENLAVVFEPLAKLAPSEEAVFRVRVRGRREGDQRMQVQLVSDDHPAPITKEEITRVYADR